MHLDRKSHSQIRNSTPCTLCLRHFSASVTQSQERTQDLREVIECSSAAAGRNYLSLDANLKDIDKIQTWIKKQTDKFYGSFERRNVIIIHVCYTNVLIATVAS